MFKDEIRDKVWTEIRQHDLRAVGAQLTPEVFSEAARRADVSIRKGPLNLVNLVWLGIASAMQPLANFTWILTTTLKLLEDQANFHSTPLGKIRKQAQQRARRQRKKTSRKAQPSKHCPYSQDPLRVSEEAFVQARQRMPLKFWMALLVVLGERFQQQHPRHLRFRGFRLLAVDGTTIRLPAEPRLRKYYGTPKNGGKKRASPQARLVMLNLLGARIPLAYEVSPLSTSELALAGRLAERLCLNDLLLMDRGFISYGLFWQIQQQGACFGTRMKKALKFKTVRRLGSRDRLVHWTPSDSRRQWKHLPPAMPLRVIDYQIPGFRPSAIVTNVLDPQRLSREDWVRLASDCAEAGPWKPGLYHRRWEIETAYYEFKVTLQLQSLRSHTPASVEYELAGRMVYYMLVRWLMVLAAEKHGLDPLRLSFVNAIREIEQLRPTMICNPLAWVTNELLPRLLDRLASHLVPLRPGRHYPRPKDTQPKDRGHGQKQAASKIDNRINSNRKPNRLHYPSKA